MTPGIKAGQRSRCSPETVGTGGIGGRGRFMFCRPVSILAMRQSVDCWNGWLTKEVLLSTMFVCDAGTVQRFYPVFKRVRAEKRGDILFIVTGHSTTSQSKSNQNQPP